MKNKYKDSISKLHISEELERNILNMTVNKEKKTKRIPRLAYTLGVILMLFTMCVGIVYAEEIKTFFTNITTTLSSENGDNIPIGDMATVEINQHVKKTIDEYDHPIVTTLKEVEKNFGIDILSSAKATSDTMSYTTGLSGDKIGRVDIWYAGFIDYPIENSVINELDKCLEKNTVIKCGSSEKEYQELIRKRKSVSVLISFITEYADEGYIDAFKYGINAVGGKEKIQTYHIESLDVDAIIYGVDWTETRLTATFVYNNMLYDFVGANMSYDEFIEVLESLK